MTLSTGEATTVYHHGRIHTLDPGFGTVEAMVVTGAKVVAVGTAEYCCSVAGSGARAVDLDGTIVIPGLTDAHLHTGALARSRTAADLRGSENLAAALQRVLAHAATLPPGAWVLGGGFSYQLWDDPILPDTGALDSVTGGRPAVLDSVDLHSRWLNSAAMERAGIDRDTPDPAGGEIVRDADGEPTGILRETACNLVDPALAADPQAAVPLADALPPTLDRLLSRGITSIHDIDDDDVLAAFTALLADGDLPLRVTKAIRAHRLDDYIAAGRSTGDGDVWLATGPVKIFADGAIASRTCWMHRDFTGHPGESGRPVTDPDEVAELVHRAAAAGIATAIHAIGDRANALVLDVLASPQAQHPRRRLRHRIEHAQYLDPGDVERFALGGIVASMQPQHCPDDIALNDALLAGHPVLSYPWRALARAGVTLAFGSDAPVAEPDPWLGMHAAVTRQRADGTPPDGWQPDETITVAEALAAYTTGPAWASGEEDVKGRLAPGLLADFVTLDTDPLTVDPAELPGISPLATVVGGRVRWTA